MKYNLLKHALEFAAVNRVNPSTVYPWVTYFGERNHYCNLVSGKSNYETDDGPSYTAFKGYLEEKAETYAPHKRKTPVLVEQTIEEKPSEVTSSASEVTKLEASIKNLRDMGYLVTCSVQLPAKVL